MWGPRHGKMAIYDVIMSEISTQQLFQIPRRVAMREGAQSRMNVV